MEIDSLELITVTSENQNLPLGISNELVLNRAYRAYTEILLKCFSRSNRPFPSSFESRYESEASCLVFIMKISFHSSANKTNFIMKSFALSLAYVMSFKTTRESLFPSCNLTISSSGPHLTNMREYFVNIIYYRTYKQLFGSSRSEHLMEIYGNPYDLLALLLSLKLRRRKRRKANRIKTWNIMVK